MKNVSNGREKLESSYIANAFALKKTVWWLLTKLSIKLSGEPAVPLLSKYPKELKVSVQTKACMWMFTVILFVIVKSGNSSNVHQLKNG